MCGIAMVSLSPKSKIRIRQLSHELLLHSEERGKIASGWAYQTTTETKYFKEARPGGHLAMSLMPTNVRAALTHTRNATQGAPEVSDNNHPVVDSQNQIILVHNGVVTNKSTIEREWEKFAGFTEDFAEVDSSVLPALVRERGFDGLTNADGWAAVGWFDVTDPMAVNAARTKGNAPLEVLKLKDGSIIAASTFQIAHAALIRIGYGDEIRWQYSVPDGTYMKFKNGEIDAVQEFDTYSYHKAEIKGTTTISAQEKQRLEAITAGTDKKPVPAAAAPTPTPTTVNKGWSTQPAGSGYVSPYKGSPQVHTTTASEPPRERLGAGVDPFGAGGLPDPPKTNLPPKQYHSVSPQPTLGSGSPTNTGATGAGKDFRLTTMGQAPPKAPTPLTSLLSWTRAHELHMAEAVIDELVFFFKWFPQHSVDPSDPYDFDVRARTFEDLCAEIGEGFLQGYLQDFGFLNCEGRIVELGSSATTVEDLAGRIYMQWGQQNKLGIDADDIIELAFDYDEQEDSISLRDLAEDRAENQQTLAGYLAQMEEVESGE